METMLSVTQSAQQLSVTRQAILKAINQNRLKAVRVGHAWTIPLRELRRYEKYRLQESRN
jgi:excisionase family DNA binding protein